MVKVDNALSTRFTNMSFVCACLVVLLHVEAAPDCGLLLWWAKSLFGPCGLAKIAVPYFFLTSGFFFARHIYDGESWYRKEISKRIRSLVIPYLLWNAVFWGFLLGLKWLSPVVGFKPGLTFPVCNGWVDVFAFLGVHPLRFSIHSHTWFLRSLFVTMLISPLIVIGLRRMKVCVICLVALIAANFAIVTMGSQKAIDFVRFIFSIEGLIYFVAGMAICLNGDKWQLPKIGAWILMAMGCVMWVAKPIVMLMVGSADDSFGWYWFFDCALMMYVVWMLMPTRPIFGGLTKCSFSLYVLHRFALILIAGVFSVVGLKECALRVSVLLYFGRALVAIIIVCVVTKVMRFLLPRITSVFLGGR